MADRSVARVYYIDWLWILAVLLLFPFHVLRVFNHEAFYVKSSAVSDGVNTVLGLIGLWHMPLLFFLAGCSTYYALQKRSAGVYAWERNKRLLVPLVFGIFILIPPQTWFGARFNSGYTGSYWHYLASGDFLQWNIQGGGDYFGGFGLGHLWFLLWLFYISLFALTVTAWGARGRGAGRVGALSRRLAQPVWWLLPIVILFLGEAVPDVVGKPTVFYFFVFLLGFAAVSGPRFAESAERYRFPAVGAGVALTVFWVLSADFRDSLPDPSWGRAGLALLFAAAVWSMLVGLMELGKRYLNRTSRTQRYLAEGSYPVYILHQTVIVILAFYVVGFAFSRPAQAVILFVLAVAGTFALYEIVRRIGVLRFLFGMKYRPRSAVEGASPDSAGRP
jgi:peptidoglycan/LPS O-acetylase OafA/YrhL